MDKQNMDRNRLVTLLGLALVAVLLAFVMVSPEAEYSPQSIRVGVLPDEDEASLRKRHGPLLSYLSTQAGVKTELVIPKDYSHLLTLFGEKKVDLAYFGGLTFVQAEAKFNAEPLVMRDQDTRFSSLFVARADAPQQNLEDFKGASLSFGSELSTSGHLMPRYFIQTQLNSTAEKFFSELVFSGSHDKTAYKVKDGSVDLGVANREIIEKMFQDGRITTQDIKIIWQTPPYSDYVWSVQKDLNNDLKNNLRDAFLRLSDHYETDQELLAKAGAGMFLPANRGDYKQLRSIAAQRGLLE